MNTSKKLTTKQRVLFYLGIVTVSALVGGITGILGVGFGGKAFTFDIDTFLVQYSSNDEADSPDTASDNSEEFVRNIVSSLKQKLIDEMQYWKGQILNDEPESKLEALMMNTEKDFASIFTQIDKLTIGLVNKTNSKKSIPFWTRATGIDEDSEEPLGEIDIDSSDLFDWLTSDQFVKRIISDDSLSKLDAKSDQWQKQLKSLISEQTIRNIFESKDYRRAMSIATDIGEMFHSIKQLIIDNISQEISELSTDDLKAAK